MAEEKTITEIDGSKPLWGQLLNLKTDALKALKAPMRKKSAKRKNEAVVDNAEEAIMDLEQERIEDVAKMINGDIEWSESALDAIDLKIEAQQKLIARAKARKEKFFG